MRRFESHYRSGSDYQPTSDDDSSDFRSSASKESDENGLANISSKKIPNESDDESSGSIPPVSLNVKLLNNKLNVPSNKCFYKTEEPNPDIYYDGSRRQARRNICYAIESDSDEEISTGNQIRGKKDTKISDSDFEVIHYR